MLVFFFSIFYNGYPIFFLPQKSGESEEGEDRQAEF